MIRALLVDDEPLALERLSRLVRESGRVEIVGAAQDAPTAFRLAQSTGPDLVFLDIDLPGESGLDLAARLPPLTAIVFTTAYSEFALTAFERNAIDYLLKPVDPDHLERAIGKVARMIEGGKPRPDVQALLTALRSALPRDSVLYPARLPSKSGERVRFLEVAHISHFVARDKLTFAVQNGKEHALEFTIVELESRLDPQKFVRVHRSTIVNMDFVEELYAWFGGKLLLRLRTPGGAEVTVAKERARAVREKLGIQ